MASDDAIRATVDVAGERFDLSGRCLLVAWVDSDGRAGSAVGGEVSPVRAAMMAECAVTSATKAAEEAVGVPALAKALMLFAAESAIGRYDGRSDKVSDLVASAQIRDLAEELGLEVPDGSR